MIADLERALADHGAPLGRSHEVHGEAASTMDLAWAALAAGAPDGHVVVADHQTAGRGSHGRTWESPAGSDLYFSVILRERPLRPTMTLAVALAVADVLESRGAPRATVKWPNDVLLQDRKTAGILCESRSRGRQADLVVGIGVNVNRARFDAELEATSLRLATGREHDRGAVLVELLGRLGPALERSGDAVAHALDARLAWRGEEVCLDQTVGTLLGVAPTGALRLRVGATERHFHAGRLTH
ncbi:MAG: biotin--[acetyl-CoA-carboxylase] ligase [Sandaracinus sp.]|nr:biotin--[acetyl-CoA-carboxylase] ligase [Sandaracinus sp.]